MPDQIGDASLLAGPESLFWPGAGPWRSRLGLDELFPGKSRVIRQVLFASGQGEYSLERSALAYEASLVGTGPVFVIFAGYREAAAPFLGW